MTRFTTYDPGVPGNGAIYYAAMESIAGRAPTFVAGKPEAAQQPAKLQVDLAYDSATTVDGSVDADTGTITIHVPFSVLDDPAPRPSSTRCSRSPRRRSARCRATRSASST